MTDENATEAVTPLQAARLRRGWKQSRVIALMAARASQTGVRIAGQASLKTMLSRWENGTGQPDSVYRRLFCAIYQCDDEDLGFTDTGTLGTTITLAPTADIETVDYFRSILDQHIRADNLMGPHHLIDVVTTQAALLEAVLSTARNEIRSELLSLAYRYSEFAGWLYQDAGDPEKAMTHSDRAMDYATAAGSPIDIAYVLMRKSNIAADLGSTDRALGLTEAALRDGSKVTPRIRALVLGQQARAHALRGDVDECERSLEQAMQEASRAEATELDSIAAYSSPAYIGMQAAICWTELDMPDRAIPIFKEAIETWPDFMRRDLGICLTRLATAHASRGDIVPACDIGMQAVRTVRSATSARALHDLKNLRRLLAPWQRHDEVVKLSQAIKSLFQGR